MQNVKEPMKTTLARLLTPQHGPNVVNTEEYKLHVLKRSYQPDECEILIESWTALDGWHTTQLILDTAELTKFREILMI